MSDKLFRLIAAYQQYDWGKIGSKSAVAQYSTLSDPTVKIDETKPYAELWMGTHLKAPSKNADSNELLNNIIAKNPEETLGNDIINKFHAKNELPFLFKVLSIEKVLSIQAHPDKALGKILHAQDPKNYPDANHKPEMAIAVTDFEGFCGFKPLGEIADELKRIPELRNVVGDETADQFIKNFKENVTVGSADDQANRKLLQSVFSKVMNAPEDQIVQNARALIQRAHDSPADFNKADLPDLLIRLNKQFPDDIGLFCGGLLLNHCRLNAGEGLFLRAKDPHAYISGDIIECMAASDNVVRAGFTPKFKDVKNLVEMLTYNYGTVDEQKMVAEKFPRSSGNGESLLYNPPIEEFAVLETTFKTSTGKRHFEGVDGPSVLIVTKGNGKISTGDVKLDASTGFVFFVAANTPVDLETTDSTFTSYRAFVEPN
ncbi:similar to Saccharomyces cerevisiae YER003C PMI40 Mannose-6-phosphate isomerase, catalyzes the interconversion of fructose-6-P and mannose- 6-P [Maudiozyma barnettii]|uniref:Mannose-6-phosphate isomerase n=1 Tax=Maudiozyma barnettii TaxID=61262 RepID=A0A8H2VIM5_9SACH|nr:mannose-6-phosphate isomerase PMI40 [Kazachstania barnettii]CAB4256391.1 similar to Saccharomyces cerevisiae YER003C PMI40 Mannose-6-phosphate isomerase, catalyzes the interconversion of fructose-6-P and mannose- 6-P [Kazachstania barnettii]CAD1785000.1 similar to Saccharomyces cerevisiae YER003C PMI40 Mannose-6-phosphate isomerase, catalyzes the interconversion of fructose-6-P and mannose- 6-P [Kazachstania barnettii]